MGIEGIFGDPQSRDFKRWAADRLIVNNSRLLKVEDTFLIKGRGLVLVPNLPLPTTGKFKPRYDKVVVLIV